MSVKLSELRDAVSELTVRVGFILAIVSGVTLFAPRQFVIQPFGVWSVSAHEKPGSNSGVVTTADSASVKGAVLTAVRQSDDVERPREFPTRTDDNGNFRFAYLPSGTYLVQVVAPR